MKSMKRKFFPILLTLLALLVCAISLAGCSSTSFAGKYSNGNDSNVYELKEDNTWTHGENEKGTFELNDGTIVFFKTDGTEFAGTLQNNVLKVNNQDYNRVAEENFFTKYGIYIFLGVVVVLFIVWFIFSGRKNKSRQKEYVEQLEAIRPGHKVKTAGGICGIVLEVCDDNTIIMETGSEASGKSYIKLDKESIYQTDAKGPTQIAREEAEAARKAAKEGKGKVSAPAPESAPAPDEPAPTPEESATPDEPASAPDEPSAPPEE